MDIKELHEAIDKYFAGNEISEVGIDVNAYYDFYQTTMNIVGIFRTKKESNRLYFGIPKKETT